jgi:ribose transport system substrate-binding protein
MYCAQPVYIPYAIERFDMQQTTRRRQSRMTRAAVLLALILATALTACSSGASSGASGGGKLRLGLVLPSLTVSTIHQIDVGAKARAKQTGATILDAGSSQTVDWLNDCQRIINSGIDVLAYSTLDEKGTRSCITQANSMHIPIICVLPCTPIGNNNVTLTIDFKKDGETIGNWIGKSVGGTGEVGVLVGAPGDQAAADLVSGFKNGLTASCPECKLVAEAPGGYNRQMAYNSALTVLSAHPNIKALYSLNDDGALGAVQAIQQNGKAGKIIVAGHNGSCDAIQNIMQKKGLGFTVLLDGDPFGAAAIDTALQMKAGKKVAPTINLSAVPLDYSAIQGYLNGSTPNPSGIDVKATLTNIQQHGCPAGS